MIQNLRVYAVTSAIAVYVIKKAVNCFIPPSNNLETTIQAMATANELSAEWVMARAKNAFLHGMKYLTTR